MGSDLGDVNNDGLIDFLVADMATTTHQKDQRSMAELARARPRNRRDNSAAAPKYHRSALYLNTGTGRCLEAAYLAGIAATDWTWSPRFEDLDNDGRLDLFVTNGCHREPERPTCFARLMQAESRPSGSGSCRTAPCWSRPIWPSATLATCGSRTSAPPGGSTRRASASAPPSATWPATAISTSCTRTSRRGVTLMRNDNDTGHRVMVDLRGTVSNRFGVGARSGSRARSGVQVRQLVLARGYLSSSEPMLHFGLGADTVIRRMAVTWPSGHVQTFEDLPVDRRYTVTEPSGPRPGPAEPPPGAGAVEEEGRAEGFDLASREEVVDETSLQRVFPARSTGGDRRLRWATSAEGDATTSSWRDDPRSLARS